jgi:ribosomal protein L18
VQRKRDQSLKETRQWLRREFAEFPRTRIAVAFTIACALRLPAPQSVRAFACIAPWDSSGKTLASASSVDKETKKGLKGGGNVAAAKVIGKAIADRAKAAGVSKVVFDRGGYKYHGRVKALADAAREAGLQF